jgi:hypothetical protein
MTKQLFEIEVREWSKHLKSSSGGSWGRTSPDKAKIDRQYGPGRMRIIS